MFLSAAPAAADEIEAGRLVFRAQCIACHAVGCNRVGPKLQDVFGRLAGTVADYPSYTDALKKSGILWDEEKLNSFFADPAAMVPGTMMWAGKVDDAHRRRELIAFLRAGDTSLDLCPK